MAVSLHDRWLFALNPLISSMMPFFPYGSYYSNELVEKRNGILEYWNIETSESL